VNNKTDAAGNPLNGPAAATLAAQSALDAANRATAASRTQDAKNNGYTAPPAAFEAPGWTVDPVTGRAAPPR